MKKMIILFFLFTGWQIQSQAQAKKPVTVKISTPGVQCADCAKRIEDYLKYEEGITKTRVDYRHGSVTVTYMPDRTNLENIKTAIANVGYDADDVKANEDSYKRLPKTCKRPEDGGHPKH